MKNDLSGPSIIFILFLTMLFIVIISPTASAQNGATTVNVDLDQASQDSHVDSEADLLEFTGKVTVITASTRDIYVSLCGEIENLDEYYLEITPRLLVFTKSDQKSFQVDITIPQATHAGTYKLTVETIWYYAGDEIPNEPQDADEALINVKQYHSMSIESQVPYQELEWGDTTTFSIDVINTGNGRETLDLDKDLPIGWVLQFEILKFQLDPDESRLLKITIISPGKPDPGHYSLKINFTSSESTETIGTYTIHAYVESDNKIVLAGGNLPILILASRDLTLGTLEVGEQKDIELTVRCYVETTKVTINYEVLKFQNNKYLPETNLSIKLLPSTHSIAPGSSGTFNLKIIANNSNYMGRKLEITEILRVQAVSTEPAHSTGVEITPQSNKITLDFIVINQDLKQPDRQFLTTTTGIAVTSSLILVGVFGALAGGTEFGKYRAFSLLFVPLYTRLHKDKILDHFTRGRVYEYIRNNPGSYYSLIKRELGLNNGGLTYHLRTLEREELVRSRRAGIYKLFYPTQMKIPETIGLGLNTLQKSIVEEIRKHPGISQTEIGVKITDKNQRTVSHNIKTMARKGIIILEKDGRNTKCYIADTYEDDIDAGTVFNKGPHKTQSQKSTLNVQPSDGDMVIKKI